MPNNLVAVVTGANKGLGFAIVKGLCQKFDGIVYLTARDETRGKDACEALQKLGLKPIFHQLDITDVNSIQTFCTHIQDKHGKIDVLINNAGILILNNGDNSKLYAAELTMTVNFFSLINFCEAMIPLINDNGKIINISSSSGHLSRIPSEELRKRISSPDLSLDMLKELMGNYIEAVKKNKEVEEGWGENPYVVSKVGVNAYTFLLHRRLSNKGIQVNCVHPGYVMSDMTKGAGNVTPDQAAEVPLRLALMSEGGGLFVWRDSTAVPWDGPDPRTWIDGKT